MKKFWLYRILIAVPFFILSIMAISSGFNREGYYIGSRATPIFIFSLFASGIYSVYALIRFSSSHWKVNQIEFEFERHEAVKSIIRTILIAIILVFIVWFGLGLYLGLTIK